ncbi:unnamed protein product [Sphagnum balticum]
MRRQYSIRTVRPTAERAQQTPEYGRTCRCRLYATVAAEGRCTHAVDCFYTETHIFECNPPPHLLPMFAVVFDECKGTRTFIDGGRFEQTIQHGQRQHRTTAQTSFVAVECKRHGLDTLR